MARHHESEEASPEAEAVNPADPRRFAATDPALAKQWIPDILGAGFERMTLPLPGDDEGECVATLVRHVPDADPSMPAAPAPRFAALSLHGWNDYFYHRHVARAVTAAGGAFYALDLRKYGRSLRAGQTAGFTTNLTVYDEDIEAALATIAETSPGLPLFLAGHSTGGLIASLWADSHPGTLVGLILNSPWLEFQSFTALRTIGSPVISALGRLTPKQVIPTGDNGFYQRTLTAWRDGEELAGTRTEAEIEAGLSHLRAEGEQRPDMAVRAAHPWGPPTTDDPFWTTGWLPDERFRVYPSWAARAAWLSAILAGHARIAAGLAIDCPVLVLTSGASAKNDEWSEERLRTDGVLDVRQIWKRVASLGPVVHLRKLDGAIHDVYLSRESVRTEALESTFRFIDAVLAGQMPMPRGIADTP